MSLFLFLFLRRSTGLIWMFDKAKREAFVKARRSKLLLLHMLAIAIALRWLVLQVRLSLTGAAAETRAIRYRQRHYIYKLLDRHIRSLDSAIYGTYATTRQEIYETSRLYTRIPKTFQTMNRSRITSNCPLCFLYRLHWLNPAMSHIYRYPQQFKFVFMTAS